MSGDWGGDGVNDKYNDGSIDGGSVDIVLIDNGGIIPPIAAAAAYLV